MTKLLPAPAPKTYLPHVIRIFSAGLYLSGIAALLSINISMVHLHNNNRFRQPTWSRIRTAFDHIAFAEQLWRNGYIRDAQRELQIGKELLEIQKPVASSPFVLGANDTAMSIEDWEKERDAITGQIGRWQDISRTYPDFRDAYVQLAVLFYRLNNIEESKSYIGKVKALDPNFELTGAIAELLEDI